LIFQHIKLRFIIKQHFSYITCNFCDSDIYIEALRSSRNIFCLTNQDGHRNAFGHCWPTSGNFSFVPSNVY